MKATGIVRRIDDLGRIVIPKEIRRSFRIKEGDPLEIFTDAEGEVIFKKYSPIGELSNFASHMLKCCIKTAGFPLRLWIMTMLLQLPESARGKFLSEELQRILKNLWKTGQFILLMIKSRL